MLVFSSEHFHEGEVSDYFYIWKKRKIKLISILHIYLQLYFPIFFINYAQNQISLIF